jgi:hypothetical protein
MRILQILFSAAILGALAWSGWWYALATGQEAALAAWFDDRGRAGWQAERNQIALTGFPLTVTRRITDIRLADPKTGWAWRAPWLQVESAPASPNRVTVTWPDAQSLAVPGELADITSDTMTAKLELWPGPSLSLISATAQATRLDVRARSGWEGGAGSLKAEVSERTNDDGYAITLNAEAVTLPAPLLARIDPIGLAGSEIERITVDGAAVFDAPLDRKLVEDGKLALRAATIRRAGFQWGEMRLEAKGAIKVDPEGYPVGKLEISAKQWRQIITMARRSGAISADLASGLTKALRVVALLAGDIDKLDATLTFQDGEVWIGPLSIGRAPRLAPARG